MSKQSAGILVFRPRGDSIEVLLVHPAGPIWGKRDTWSIPKGELDEGEDHLAAAFREFEEEVGIVLDQTGELIDLGSVKQPNKTNYIWALEAELDLSNFSCQPFTMEWPPKSGKLQEFPENDRAEWFSLAGAKQKLFKSQTIFIDRLAERLKLSIDESPGQQSLL